MSGALLGRAQACARNSASAFGAKVWLSPVARVIAEIADHWQLVQGDQIEDYLSGLAQISQLVPGLDFPRSWLTECFHYCGPLRDIGICKRRAEGEPRKRAFTSFGTLQGHRAALFARIARAAQANGLHLTLAHGGGLSRDQAARLARLAEVHAFVPQDEVLAQCDLAILHGGLNTVLDALSLGVPIVLMPLAFEQGAIAARVVRSGAGRIGSRFRVRSLPRVVAEVLADPTYACAAGVLQTEIQAAGGVVKAADVVESVARTGGPSLNPDLLERSAMRA